MRRTLFFCCLGILVIVLLVGIGWNAQQIRQQQQRDRALYDAVAKNDPASVSAVLARGADPDGRHAVPVGQEINTPWDAIMALFRQKNKPDPGAMTPLADSARPMPEQLYGKGIPIMDRTPVMRILLEHGAKINAGRDVGQTALTIATQNHQVAAVRFLLEHGADANARDAFRMVPLMWASRYPGNIEIARMLLDHGADVNLRTRDGDTALMIAAGSGPVELVRLLLDHHADVHPKGLGGRTALGEAQKSHMFVTDFMAGKQFFPAQKHAQLQIITLLKKAGATE